MFSHTDLTQAAHGSRTDALFDGQDTIAKCVRVLDRSDMLDMLGNSSDPGYLVEGQVAQGADKHPYMTAAAWKKVPKWLENPAAVLDSDTKPGSLVFVAPASVAGSPAIGIVKPSPMTGGAALSVSLLTNAYDAERKPFQRWEKDGLLRYFDRQKATPVTGSFQPQLAGLPGQQGRNNFLTEKNLADAKLPKRWPTSVKN